MAAAQPSGSGQPPWSLGRSTKRGIRKCPKCGVFTGTRGFTCKNKSCDMVFKNASERRKKLVGDACKLFIDNDVQLYSVRLNKSMGPDYRGFVQTPVFEGMNPAKDKLDESDNLLLQSASHCYVENCLHEENRGQDLVMIGEGCSHIKACFTSTCEAMPVKLRHSAMNDLAIKPEFKQQVYAIAQLISGPLVQRVNEQVFVVKCDVDVQHPLGYLHIAFIDQKLRDRPRPERKMFCTCHTFRGLDRSSQYFTQWDDNARAREPEWILKRCVHFYSCLCAFASDLKLKEEFKYYIELDSLILSRNQYPVKQQQIIIHQPLTIKQQMPDTGDVFNLFDKDNSSVQVELLESYMDTDDKLDYDGGSHLHQLSDSNDEQELHLQMNPEDGQMQMLIVGDNILLKRSQSGQVTTTKTTKNAINSIVSKKQAIQSSSEEKPDIMNMIGPSSSQSQMALQSPSSQSMGNESAALTFRDWLASVTEQINQTMHYQFDGKPDPLVFHAPQMFFDCLRERVSAGSKKKRLPNSTIAFVRKDSLPLGVFTKYTWCITNIIHVKRIFDTAKVPLEITRSFVQNQDGTYSLQSSQKVDPMETFNKVDGKPKIAIQELKTFLKVGRTSADNEKEVHVFQIEWVPDILPTMHIGELTIQFEYGHIKNGVVVQNRIGLPSRRDDRKWDNSNDRDPIAVTSSSKDLSGESILPFHEVGIL